MGWRFRTSFKVIPGLRLNLSRNGLSASIGGAPFTVNVGPHGVTGTASIPSTGISYREHVEIDKEQAEPYFRLRDDFAAMSECKAIWDIKSHQATDMVHERTTAGRRVERQRVTFSLGGCDLIQWEQKVPHLENSKGGDLYFYPGFILYRAAKQAFSVIDYHDVNGNAVLIQFQEQEGVPSDSKVVSQAWAKANKDGSRDKRFADNFQIPVALYGQVTFKSQSGLWEEFQFSNTDRLQQFLNSLKAFVASFESPKSATA